MFKRNLMVVWIGIFALSGIFLMGQDSWGPPPVPPPDMAIIPGGCFDMGDALGDGNPDVEGPVHNVCISAFEIDFHEVTNAEYAECVDDAVCNAPLYSDSHTRATYYGDPAYDDFPVIFVDWHRAEAFCTWAGKRLPTEAEWEYAARGGLAGNRYPWGDTISSSDANYNNDVGDTTTVGSFAPNGYGLYDVTGNVWEWVNDLYQSDYYSISPLNNPPGPGSGDNRVLRGGSWYDAATYLRVSFRNNAPPDIGYTSSWGIRCAR